MGRQVIRIIVRSPELRRVVVAFAGFNLAEALVKDRLRT